MQLIFWKINNLILLIIILIALIAVFITFYEFKEPIAKETKESMNWKEILVKIEWDSMSPTLINWEHYKATSDFDINRFDIVTFEILFSEKQYVKRVIWIPWDRIILMNETNTGKEFIWINWKYKIKSKDWKLRRMLIKNDSELVIWKWFYLLIWDNWSSSNDSYDFWFIHESKIMNKLTN